MRTADDYVDAVPQQRAHFKSFCRAWDKAIKNPAFDTAHEADEEVSTRVIKNMVQLTRDYAFDVAWIQTFLTSMQSDLDGRTYQTLDDALEYMHGSAEVIGLMMAKIMGLPPAAYEAAMLQGRAMQYINFIRDIAEDNGLGRCYFPREHIERFGLPDLSEETARTNRAAFTKFIRFEIGRYRKWQAEAEEGYQYLPARYRVPVKTAADMYSWTAKQIEKDPLMVFVYKIKPSKRRVTLQAASNLLR